MDFTNNALDWRCDYVGSYYMGGDEMSKAVKHNKGKIKMSCLFVDLAKELEQVAKVLSDGADKYGANNWQQGKPDKNFFTDALLRHQTAMFKGEDIDESGSPHLAHQIANNLIELWYLNNEVLK